MGDMISFPLWGIAALAALLAIFAVIAILRFGSRQLLGVVAATIVIFGLGWFALDRLEAQDKADQRRAIEARVVALNAQALLPNSHLSCLDAAGGDLVHEACEKSLFAGPEQVAAALNYVGARLDVLREIAALPNRDQAAYDSLRAPIVRSLESDRFGLVAQVLMARDDCQPETCYAFDFLQRRDRLVANMRGRAYDVRVTQFAASWNDKPAAQPGAALASSQASPPAPSHMPVNINFPTADSIPAVSIMSNEPGRPGQNGVTAAPRPESRPQPTAPQTVQAPPAPPRRPAQKAQAPRAAQPSAPPVEAAADPFPPPVGSTPQTTGSQPQ
jgi:hypothetical protein